MLKQNDEKIGNFLFRYRGEIPVLFLIIGLYVRYNHYLAGNQYDSYYDFACLFVSLLGFAMRVHGILTTGPFPTATGSLA